VSRINWSSAAQGAQVVPVLLIHGMPVILYPDGVSVTSFSLTSPDAAWWPGNTYANWTAYAKPWLMLEGEGIRFVERAIPAAAQVLDVSEVTLHLSDVDGAATTLFASEFLARSTYLTSSVLAGDSTIGVVSTASFDASGVIYLDQEAIAYSSKTGTSFTGCTRGRFGSKASRHTYAAASGAGLGNPIVTDRSVEYVGLPATMWLVRIVAGVIIDAQLEHYGTVGTGPSLAGGGDATDDAWVVTIDHAVKRMAQKIFADGVSVGGYAHPGNTNGRATGLQPLESSLTPFFWRAADDLTSANTIVVLTGDDAAPDNGGWHPTRESFVQALTTAGASTGLGNWRASLTNGALQVQFFSAPPHHRHYYAFAPCCETSRVTNDELTAAENFVASFGPMAEAWVPILTDSPVYLTASDFAKIPNAPSSSLASYVLVFGDDGDRSTRRVARITGQSGGSAPYLTCTALTTAANARGASTGSGGTAPPDGTALWRGGFTASGFILTEPTTARLGLYVRSTSWVVALQTIVESLDTEYAFISDAIDWTRMEAIASAYPSVLSARREYVVDLSVSLLSILQNEAALNGFSVTMYRGRVSITRIAEFAATEDTQDALTSTDLDARSPVPTYERGADGIVNTFTVISPDDGVTVNVADRTSHAKYGGQGTITATMPRTLLGYPRDGSRLYQQVFAQAVQVLGPLRYPYRHVTVQVPLNHYDLQVGDLVRATLWRVPNGSGGRGITDAVTQVMAREVTLYADGSEGHVAYTLRLNPSSISGYAPAGMVAASGISGATVTLDVSSIPNGLTGTGDDAAAFAVGDLVRLVEIDTASPTASTQHTVTAVGTNTLTLNPAPGAPFGAPAALKVLVVYDDWTVLTAGNRTEQERYCFLAQADGTLDATHAARTFAA
jgi:hypothetical protein